MSQYTDDNKPQTCGACKGMVRANNLYAQYCDEKCFIDGAYGYDKALVRRKHKERKQRENMTPKEREIRNFALRRPVI